MGLVGAVKVSEAVAVLLLVAVGGREVSGSRVADTGASVGAPDDVAGR